MKQLERVIQFEPAFDKRSTGHGIHGANMRWLLKGDLGVIQFLVYTGWHLPNVRQELASSPARLSGPMAVDIGYHSPTPMYEGQSPMTDCEFLGGTCYYDGSSLRAESFLGTLIAKGHEAVWQLMEGDYEARFGTTVEAEPGEVAK